MSQKWSKFAWSKFSLNLNSWCYQFSQECRHLALFSEILDFHKMHSLKQSIFTSKFSVMILSHCGTVWGQRSFCLLALPSGAASEADTQTQPQSSTRFSASFGAPEWLVLKEATPRPHWFPREEGRILLLFGASPYNHNGFIRYTDWQSLQGRKQEMREGSVHLAGCEKET